LINRCDAGVGLSHTVSILKKAPLDSTVPFSFVFGLRTTGTGYKLMRKSWGLFDFILLLGVVSAVFGLFWSKKQSEDMQKSVVQLKRTAGELVVDDESLYWVHERRSLHGEQTFDVHVPEGKEHFLAIATTGIYRSITENFPTHPKKTIPISSGRHQITFTNYKRPDGRAMHSVTLDGDTHVEVEKSKFVGRGIAALMGHYFTPTSTSAHEGACHLYTSMTYPKDNEEFRNVQLGTSPTEGVCIWIGSR